jgi:hypothetical protein
MNKKLTKEQTKELEKLLIGGSKMMENADITVDGYKIPSPRSEPWEPLTDDMGRVIYEQFYIPIEWVKIMPNIPTYQEVTTSNFVVEILGEEVSMETVCFPILQVNVDNGPHRALVVMTRAKKKIAEDERG